MKIDKKTPNLAVGWISGVQMGSILPPAEDF
jgi:hypothetical protein